MVMTDRILITGGTGKLGRELLKLYPSAIQPAHKELDITNKQAVMKFVKLNSPNTIVHTAAIANVRQCEDNKALAWRTNVEGTQNLVEACLEHTPDSYFVYISTACVFHGDKGDYVEDDIPYPKNFYSLSKLLGESVVRNTKLNEWLIVRTNFVAREKWPHPRAFADRYGTYLFADDVAAAVKSILPRRITGVVHVCGEEKMSMLELARIVSPGVEPMTLADYSGPPLTVDMSLRSTRLRPFKITKTMRDS
jgi:dTDP-4-dehydrorhamnose reductase